MTSITMLATAPATPGVELKLRQIPYAISFTGDRVYPEDLDVDGKMAALLHLRCPMCLGAVSPVLGPRSATDVYFRHHVADELHHDLQCPWLSAGRTESVRAWDREFTPKMWSARFHEVVSMVARQAWLTRGVSTLLTQLAPACFPPEFQFSLANRRAFVDFLGLLPTSQRTFSGKTHAVELLPAHPMLSPAAPGSHSARMRALADQLVFNPSFRAQARLLWWLATTLCARRQQSPSSNC